MMMENGTQTDITEIDNRIKQLKDQINQLEQAPQQNVNYNLLQNINNKIAQLQQKEQMITHIMTIFKDAPKEASTDPNVITQPSLIEKLDKLYNEKDKLVNEIRQLQQQQLASVNQYIQQPPFNGIIDINTPQGQQLVQMIQAQDPNIKVKPIPNTHLLQITFNDKPIAKIKTKPTQEQEEPIKTANAKTQIEEEDSLWEYILGGFIILMAMLSCILAFINLDKKKDEIEEQQKTPTKEEAVKPNNKPKQEEKPQTTEQKDADKPVEVEEKICVATTEQEKTIEGKVVGNCNPQKTDVKGVELTDDAKQALNTVANPENRYTIKNDTTGKTETGYSISGSSDGTISWRDALGNVHRANKDTITIADRGGQTISEGAENIICNLTHEQRGDTNVVDWYFNSTTKVEHNPSTGNVVDLTYQNSNSTWGSVGITENQIGTANTIPTLPLETLQRATLQPTAPRSFLSNFSIENDTLKVNDLSNTYRYNDNTYIGDYHNTRGFSSNIGNNGDIKKVVETENTVLGGDNKLKYTDQNGNEQTLNNNVFGYEVDNGKLTVKYDFEKDTGTYSTKTYNLSDYNNLNITSDLPRSQISNSQINLANNIQKYVDPTTGKTHVYANGLTAETQGVYGSNNYTTTFNLGGHSSTLSNLTADNFRNNETLVNMYNNDNKLYNYIRLNEGYDHSKFTTNSINNYNQLNNLNNTRNTLYYK